MKTAQRLAKELKLGVATICRDGRFAIAVDLVTEHCGLEAMQAILARDANLTRGAVIRLANKNPEDQRAAFKELIEKGKLPRRPGKKKLVFTLPAESSSVAATLLLRLGAKGTGEVLQALARLLKGQRVPS